MPDAKKEKGPIAKFLEPEMAGKNVYETYSVPFDKEHPVRSFVDGPLLKVANWFLSGSQTGLAKHAFLIAAGVLGGRWGGIHIAKLLKDVFEKNNVEINDLKKDPGNQWRNVGLQSIPFILSGIGATIGSYKFFAEKRQGIIEGLEQRLDTFSYVTQHWYKASNAAVPFLSLTTMQGISSGPLRLLNGAFIGDRFLLGQGQTVKTPFFNKLLSGVKDLQGGDPDLVRKNLITQLKTDVNMASDLAEIACMCRAMLVRCFKKTETTTDDTLNQAALIMASRIQQIIIEEVHPAWVVSGKKLDYTRESSDTLEKALKSFLTGENLDRFLFQPSSQAIQLPVVNEHTLHNHKALENTIKGSLQALPGRYYPWP